MIVFREKESMPDSIVILGAYGGAREMFWYLKESYPGTDVVFVDDITDIVEVNIAGRTYPVVKDWDFRTVRKKGGAFEYFTLGLGYPKAKKILVEKALKAGLVPAPTLISSSAVVRPDCIIGRGGVIFGTSNLLTEAVVGDYAYISNTPLGHAAVLGNYVSCFAGAHVSSEVTLGEGVLLGAGSVVKEEVTIADWVTVGAQSCVVKDILEPNITVCGVPARKLSNVDQELEA